MAQWPHLIPGALPRFWRTANKATVGGTDLAPSRTPPGSPKKRFCCVLFQKCFQLWTSCHGGKSIRVGRSSHVFRGRAVGHSDSDSAKMKMGRYEPAFFLDRVQILRICFAP